jgi:hypothetical protein
MQIGAGYCATRSANRLVFCDSLMQTAISKRGTPLGLHRQPLRRKTLGIGIANPLVEIDQIRMTGNSGVIGDVYSSTHL